MPELPEVEIVKQSLKNKIKFKKIKKVTVRNRNLRFKLKNNFENVLKNRLVKEVSRISKYLILELDNQKYCIIHFGMSGTMHLINQWNVEYIYFWADTFLAWSQTEFNEFCEMYQDFKLPFWIQTRPETLNEEKVKKRIINVNRFFMLFSYSYCS